VVGSGKGKVVVGRGGNVRVVVGGGGGGSVVVVASGAVVVVVSSSADTAGAQTHTRTSPTTAAIHLTLAG